MAENQAPQSVENRNISITDEGEGNADVAQPDNTPEDDIDINVEDDNQGDEENGDDDIIIHEPEPEPDIEIEDSSTQNSGQTPPTGAPAMPPPPPPPPPSEPPEPPVEEASEEEAEQPETSPEEEREERQDYLLELIDDFADLSDEELAGMTEFQELSTKEKVVKVLKTGARRAVVYAVIGVGAYALLHAAPVVIAAGAVGGFAGSSIGRGLVDAVKWISGAEKKERAVREELSNIEVEKLTNLRNLALRARTLIEMPAGQGQSVETGQIETAEQAKADFLNALIEYNDSQSQSNQQIAGLRKKLSRSRLGWGVAKGVVGLVGGIAGGMAGAAELKAVLAEKIAEKGIHMTGEGLGQLDPGVAVGHNVHLENGEVVFDYAGGAGGQELAGVYGKIAENPELAQYFQSELISRGMHEAGDALGQEFMQRVGQVASERAAEYVAGAVGVAEATDAVWRNARRNRPDSWVKGASDEVRGEAGEYQGDLQAEAGARQNERFRSMFVDQSGQVPEGVPSIGESITLDQGFSLSGPEGNIEINSGDHLQILGVDQNGNILATHTETGQILAFQRDEFYQNIIQPRVPSEPEIEEEEEETPIEEIEETEEENLIEKERQELVGTVQTAEVDKVIDSTKFVCVVNGKPRRVTSNSNLPAEVSAGQQVKINITEVWGGDNEFVRGDVEPIITTERVTQALPEWENPNKDQKALNPAPEQKALPPAEFETEERLRNQAQESLSPGAEWVLASGDEVNMIAERVAEPSDKVEQIQIKDGEKYILDNITKQYRHDVIVFHRIDQLSARDVMQADPNTFLRRLTPVFIKEILDKKEQEKAREILLEEYQNIIDKIPGRDPFVTEEKVEENAEPEEEQNSMEETAETEGKNGREFEKIERVDQLKIGDQIFISGAAPASLEVSTSGGEERKSLARDFRPKAEFTFNGPAPEEEGVGLFEIERKGVKYYLYDEDVVNGFELVKKLPEPKQQSEPQGPLPQAEEQKALPPAREEASPAQRMSEMVKNQEEARKKASENYKMVRAEQQNSTGESQTQPEEEQGLRSYDFEYGLNNAGEQVRKDIAPGQSWQIDSEAGSFQVGIEKITPGNDAGYLTIKFRGAEPQTRSVKSWKKFFEKAENLRPKEA